MRPLLSLLAAAAIALPSWSFAQAPETVPNQSVGVNEKVAAKPTPAPRVVKPKADPISGPEVTLPATVTGNVGSFIRVKATTTGKFVEWFAKSDGLNVFPSDMLRDSRETVVTALAPGEYRLIAWTAAGDVPSKAAECIVVVAGVGPAPPVVVPTTPTTPTTPDLPPVVVPTDKPTAAVYVYEKDDGAIPPAVAAGIGQLNREKKVVATSFEEDSLDGDGNTPDQYVVPKAAAQAAGLPAFVVLSGDKVLNVVKSPTTIEQVIGAVP